MRSRSNRKPVLGQRSTSKNTWPRWAAHLSPRYGHVILVSRYLVLTGVINANMDVHISKKLTVNQGCIGCISLSTYYLEDGRHLARLRCRRRRRGRAYAPTSNTASHDNHEKIHWWVSLDFHIWDTYGAPLGGPLYMGYLWGSPWRTFGPPELRYHPFLNSWTKKSNAWDEMGETRQSICRLPQNVIHFVI